MIHSMTGFGRAQATADGIAVNTELKSINSRYLDISFRLPKEVRPFELQLKELIQKHVLRGTVTVSIRIDKSETGQPAVAINPKLTQGYKKLLEHLRETAQLETPITLADLMQFDEVFMPRQEDPETLEAIRDLSLQATRDALQKLTETRQKEGAQLQEDLSERINKIENRLSNVQQLLKDRASIYRNQLLQRIQKLIDEDKIDDDRLEMEVAILVDKMDVTEEIVRLQAHIKFFREALKNDEPTGRRFKFLSQEMNREINTIGSKANDSEVSQQIVYAKESLEQIREQIMNVE